MVKIVTSQQASDRLKGEIAARVAAPTYVWGLSWGFPTLDYWTGGIQTGDKKDVITLIARSGVGKSSIAGKICLNVAVQLLRENVERVKKALPRQVVRIVSLEMSSMSYQLRMACALSGVPSTRVRAGDITREEQQKVAEALDKIGTLPIEYIEENIGLTEIENFIKSTRGNTQCAFWMLDHIGIVPGINPNHQTASLATICNTVREICHDHATGLILSQMNRDADKRQDKRPQMCDGYGSSYLEANSDVMLGLYREAIYTDIPTEKRNEPQPAELLLLKQREGHLGTVHMVFTPPSVDFREAPDLNPPVNLQVRRRS